MHNTYGIGIMSPFTFSQVSHFLYELKSCSTLPDMSGKVEQDFRDPSKVPKYFFLLIYHLCIWQGPIVLYYTIKLINYALLFT